MIQPRTKEFKAKINHACRDTFDIHEAVNWEFDCKKSQFRKDLISNLEANKDKIDLTYKVACFGLECPNNK